MTVTAGDLDVRARIGQANQRLKGWEAVRWVDGRPRITDVLRAEVDRYLDAADGALAVVTLAPELPGALDTVRRLVAEGIVVAIGHTDATADIEYRFGFTGSEWGELMGVANRTDFDLNNHIESSG
ncbi:hypothetical protein IAE22_30715, partial [Bacillus sp. S34]|nr:hypothetical protein [Bacillus sp. S34]